MECPKAKTEVSTQSQRTQEIQRTNQISTVSERVVLETCSNIHLPCFHSGLDDKKSFFSTNSLA